MSTFTDWLARTDATDRIVVADITLREELAGWTHVVVYNEVTGLSYVNTYEVPWTRQPAAAAVGGGIFRTLLGVDLADAHGVLTSLAEVATFYDCDATPNSYYWGYNPNVGPDPFGIGNDIFVNVGGNPDAVALLMVARFSIPMASAAIDVAGGTLYHPRIAGPLPELSYTRNDTLFGVAQSAAGTLNLVNADGLFDSLVRTWIWPRGVITWKLGGPALAYANYGIIGTSIIADAVPQDKVLICSLVGGDIRLDAPIPDQLVGTGQIVGDVGYGSWPLASAAAQALRLPWLLGRMTGLVPIFVGQTDAASPYAPTEGHVVCSHELAIGAALVVRAIARSGGAVTTLTPTTHYTTIRGLLLVNAALYPDASYTFEVDGETVDGVTGPALASLVLAGETIGGTSFTAAAAENPAVMGRYFTAPIAKAEVLRLIERSGMFRFVQGVDGTWTATVWEPSTDPSAWPNLQDEELATWDAEPTVVGIVRGVAVTYVGGVLPVDQPLTAARYQVQDTAPIDTCLVDPVEAVAVGGRVLLLQGSVKAKIRTTTATPRPLTWMVGDRVMVTRRRSPGPNGAYAGYPLEIIEIHKNLDTLGCTLLLQDTDGLGLNFRQLAPDADDTTWAAATLAQRAQYVFLADDAGYADPTDLTSYKPGALW